jgi:hypothetical protein
MSPNSGKCSKAVPPAWIFLGSKVHLMCGSLRLAVQLCLVADIMIRRRRSRRTDWTIHDICFILLHQIQKRSVSGVFV